MPCGGELQKGSKPAVQLIYSSKMSLKYHGENKETDINSRILRKIGGSVILKGQGSSLLITLLKAENQILQ